MRVGAKLQNFMEQSSKGCTNNGVKHPDIKEKIHQIGLRGLYAYPRKDGWRMENSGKLDGDGEENMVI